MLDTVIDNYTHPDNNVLYVKESFHGPGIDDDVFYDFFKNVCACSNQHDCSNPEKCYCLQFYGEHYESGLLKTDQLECRKAVYECSRYCCCNATCNNSIVQKGPNKGLIVQNTKDKGYGVFTRLQLSKGTFICEYAGELIGEEIAKLRLNNPDRSRYLMLVREHWKSTVMETYVDAFEFGNIGRYLNHSCDPNCVVIPVRVGRIIPMLCIFTNRNVSIGEELTYFYCPESTTLSNKICHCGSQRCFKFIPSV